MKTDILIAGCGCAGLYCALKLPSDKKITVITKSDAESSDSFLAQGGICVQRDDGDFESFFEDTMRAGHYENDRESVKIMIEASRGIIADLVAFGADFNKTPDGSFDYTKEGAHSRSRILFHKDVTGKEITSKLLLEARKRENIEILEHTTLVDIIEENNEVRGAVLKTKNGDLTTVKCAFLVLATGGIGGLFKHSTNFKHLTGDALGIALRHGIELENVDYIQIHPTTFYSKEEGERSFLISESVRGEGAKLLNKDMERFVDELLPRDKVTDAINKQMELDGAEHVWEDMRPIPKDELLSHFPNIVEHCRKHGYEPTKECVPVVPAQHYFMGGVKVNYESKTSMERLYAVGETACNRVHGKNRLASNSLLESLVFAGRAADDMAKTEIDDTREIPRVDMSKYADLEKWNSENKKNILDEIKRSQKNV